MTEQEINEKVIKELNKIQKKYKVTLVAQTTITGNQLYNGIIIVHNKDNHEEKAKETNNN